MDYGAIIKEEQLYIRQQERRWVKGAVRARIRYLRLLKSGQAKSQRSAGAAIGLQERQSQRVWQQYRQQGYAGLVNGYTGHNFGKLSADPISRLRHYLRQGQVRTLAEAPATIAAEFGINYTVSGICNLFERLQRQRQPGRPVNIRKDAAQAEAFKKTFRL